MGEQRGGAYNAAHRATEGERHTEFRKGHHSSTIIHLCDTPRVDTVIERLEKKGAPILACCAAEPLSARRSWRTIFPFAGNRGRVINCPVPVMVTEMDVFFLF